MKVVSIEPGNDWDVGDGDGSNDHDYYGCQFCGKFNIRRNYGKFRKFPVRLVN